MILRHLEHMTQNKNELHFMKFITSAFRGRQLQTVADSRLHCHSCREFFCIPAQSNPPKFFRKVSRLHCGNYTGRLSLRRRVYGGRRGHRDFRAQ